MLTRGRVSLLILVLLAFVVAYVGWRAWQTRDALTDANADADALVTAARSGTSVERQHALSDLQASAARADRLGQGLSWSLLSHLPVIGDDAAGVRAVSSSIDVLAQDGLPPLVDAVSDADTLVSDGRINVQQVRSLRSPVKKSADAFDRAEREVSGLDSSGYVSSLKGQFNTYVSRLSSARHGLDAATTTLQVLPAMAGGDGERRYLLVFQNNAEVRSTGGLPGSWAVLNAANGALSLGAQGTGAEVGSTTDAVGGVTPVESAVFGAQFGRTFLDAGFTPDFPRAAQLLADGWQSRYPGTQLDGVIAVDPVALSYILRATGPVTVGGRTLTADNVVGELLNRPYLELNSQAQDEFFASAATELFTSVFTSVNDPLAFFDALRQAVVEQRLMVADFNQEEQKALAASPIEGALGGPRQADGGVDDSVPLVDIGVNDSTGSKMSYYLRYGTKVVANSCSGGVQKLTGTMTLNQIIDPVQAASLPDSVTGGGAFGIPPGTQLLQTRIFGPVGGTIDSVELAGKVLDLQPVEIYGRPEVTIAPYLADTQPIQITWTMTSGPGQTSDTRVRITPGVEPGSLNTVASSAC